MNILFLTTHANTGGITSYLLTLGEALVKSGHKVFVMSSGGNCVAQMEAVGIRHITKDIRTKSELHPKLWLNMGSVIDLIKNEQINVIHAQTRVTQVLGTWVSRLTGVRLVTTCHGFFKPHFFRKLYPCWGDAVIAISKPVALHLSQDFGVAAGRIHLIPNGIDLNRFVFSTDVMRRESRKKLGMTDAPLIGIIARLSDVKGIDVLIKAMPGILNKLPTVNLLIIGQGPEEDNLRKITKELSLTSHVYFKNTINQTQELLPAFDVFVMPSLMEGLGLSVMEAQACGIPVVASRVGGLLDLIDDQQSGYLVESNNPSALADRIIEALEHPDKSKAMAQKARLNIEQHFAVKGMLEKTLNVYE
jgi:glycosyltransferase involved in cell wall biosynthesis